MGSREGRAPTHDVGVGKNQSNSVDWEKIQGFERIMFHWRIVLVPKSPQSDSTQCLVLIACVLFRTSSGISFASA